MVSRRRVALGGTKVRASSSGRKVMSYARLTEKQRILADEVSDLLARPQAVDAAEGQPVRCGQARGPAAGGSGGQGIAACDAGRCPQVPWRAKPPGRPGRRRPLASMIEHTTRRVGQMPFQWTIDAGHCEAANHEYVTEIETAGGTEFFIATGWHKHGVPLWFSSRCMGGHVAPWTGARPGQWGSASSARPFVRPAMCVCNPGVDSDRVNPVRYFRSTASGACGVVIGFAWRCTSAQVSPSRR
ncbi:hypothetical protein ACVWZ8_003149 [Arthrobacter sp. UYCu723]